jgi:hypothetical protein
VKTSGIKRAALIVEVRGMTNAERWHTTFSRHFDVQRLALDARHPWCSPLLGRGSDAPELIERAGGLFGHRFPLLDLRFWLIQAVPNVSYLGLPPEPSKCETVETDPIYLN